jgi:DNA-binding response OmpR family regulator
MGSGGRPIPAEKPGAIRGREFSAARFRGIIMTASRRGRLLLVEDEARLRGLIALFLRMEDYDVVEAEDGVRGVEQFGDSGPFDLVIVDLDLPRLPGVEVCRRIKSCAPDQSVLVCSAAILAPHFAALDDLEIDRILTKPYLPANLLGEIEWAMARRSEPVLISGGAGQASNDSRWRPAPSHLRQAPSHSLVKSAKSK